MAIRPASKEAWNQAGRALEIKMMAKLVAQRAQERPAEVTALRIAVRIHTRIAFVLGS